MPRNIITDDEFNTFKNIPIAKKVQSMELYLIGIDGYKYNMQEVGESVFGNENYSFTVSLIHRCYNFSGQNAGKYRAGCTFEQLYGYRVTKNDIVAFVKKYPYGTFGNGVTFDDFLLTRIGNNDFAEKKPARSKNQNTAAKPKKQNTATQPKNQNTATQPINQGTTTKSLLLRRIVMFCLGVLGLIRMFFKGILFKNWVISLILLLHTLYMFVALKWRVAFDQAFQNLDEDSEDAKYTYIGGVILCALALIVMLFTGNLSKCWELSLIVLIYALRFLWLWKKDELN